MEMKPVLYTKAIILRRPFLALIMVGAGITLLQMLIVTSDKEINKELKQRPWFMKGGKRKAKYSQELKLFPEDAPGEDRITDQLMFQLPPNEKSPLKTILLPDGYMLWAGTEEGQTVFKRDRCPVDKCTLTSDRTHAATADAVMFNDFSFRDTDSPFDVKRPVHQIWILYHLESPLHTPPLSSKLSSVFNWTCSYRRDSEVVAPYARWVSYDHKVTGKSLDINYAANKTKKVAWLASNCAVPYLRYKYVRELTKYIPVDKLGKCGKTPLCPKSDPKCYTVLKDYKFYLSFENSNCHDYITEKFFDFALANDILPIVMGARLSDYSAIAPHKSFIHVEEFDSPKQLAEYLNLLDNYDNLYNSYFKWKGTGEFINTYFFCRVCAMLHANSLRNRSAHYTDVQRWWSHETCTEGRWSGLKFKTEPTNI